MNGKTITNVDADDRKPYRRIVQLCSERNEMLGMGLTYISEETHLPRVTVLNLLCCKIPSTRCNDPLKDMIKVLRCAATYYNTTVDYLVGMED